MLTAIIIIHSLLAVLVIFLILLHSGKDAGLSGAFGVGSTSSTYGGSSAIVEKNLDRITVVATVLFFITTYFLVKNY
ncbi:MAG: preprotein translocase subunit SecG [Thermoleophilia bacterium]